MTKNNDKKNHLATRVIFAGQEPDPSTGALMTPIYANSTFIQESPNVHKGMDYGRGDNPTRHALENCVADIESGSAGFAFGSGLAAIDAVLSLLESGSHIIAMDDLYGGTRRLFEKIRRPASNLSFSYHDFATNPDFESLITPQTKMVFLESPTNPLLKLVDLNAIIPIAKKHDLLVVVDNTFATPILQRPLEWGADIVIHSATKYLGGHSDVIGGVVVVNNDELAEKIGFIQKAAGAILGPFDSYLILRGIKTLNIRMDRHNSNAMAIAKFLDTHPMVERVIYPGLSSHIQHELAENQMDGFGGMISFRIKAKLSKVEKFVSSTQVITLAESLGGVESLIEHPASMTHASIDPEIRNAIGVTDNLVRLSVGIEDVDDLIADLEQALSIL